MRYLDEIFEQPVALRRATSSFDEDGLLLLKRALENGQIRHIILTGMGSSLYACIPFSLTLGKALDIPVTIWDAGEMLHYAVDQIKSSTLLILVSQSGESAELLKLIEQNIQPALSLSITNNKSNSLAGWADINLLTHAGEEEAVSTKTYTTTLATMHLLGVFLTNGDLSEARADLFDVEKKVEAFLKAKANIVKQIEDFFGQTSNLVYLGRGNSMASVNTAALITKESSKVFTEGLSCGAFRHGPLELVREGFNAVIFTGNDHTRALNETLAIEIADKGGKVLVIGVHELASSANLSSQKIPDVKSELIPILEMIPVQLLTIPLAKAKGFEPATFEHASKITARE